MTNPKKKISTVALLLIPIGIAINVVGGQLASLLKLPVFIDVIGTILVGALTGPFLGALTGLATNLILGVTNPTFLPYALVSIAIGWAAGLGGKKGWFTNVKGVAIVSGLIWLVTQLTAIPITVFVYGGVTGGGSSAITLFLVQTGQGLWSSVMTTTLITETVDKVVSVIVVYLLIKAIPNRTMLQFPLGGKYLDQSTFAQPETSKDDEWV